MPSIKWTDVEEYANYLQKQLASEREALREMCEQLDAHGCVSPKYWSQPHCDEFQKLVDKARANLERLKG